MDKCDRCAGQLNEVRILGCNARGQDRHFCSVGCYDDFKEAERDEIPAGSPSECRGEDDANSRR